MSTSLGSTPLSTAIADTESAVAADPAKAAAVFRVSGSGVRQVASSIKIGKFTIEADEPAALGDGAAPNPVEYVLAGLLSCQVATYRVWATKLGIALDDVTISVDGDLDFRGFFGLDESVRPGYSDIRLNVTLTGPESAGRYQELREVVDEHCPVLDIIANPTTVSSTLTVA